MIYPRSPQEFDAAIDAWHDSDTTEKLYEWLGLSYEEFELFVMEPQKFFESLSK